MILNILKPWKAFQIALLVAGGVVMLFPFFWMVISSFKSSAELLRLPPTWFPNKFTWVNFSMVLDAMPFWRYLGNSVWTSTTNTIVALFTSSIVGYVFAKYRFPGDRFIFLAIIATLVIPYEIIMIPEFLIMRDFGWINSYYVLLVPYFFNVFGIFFMRQFMLDLPDELLDAAKIDGCSHFRTYFSIVMPIMRTSVGALSIFLFMASWDSYLWPLITINSSAYMTLPIGLGTFLTANFGRFELLTAATVLSVTPMIVVFLFAQKSFIEGIALTGIKG